jgi:hypothetical protein
MTDLRYPIGPLQLEDEITDARRRHYIDEFEKTPANLHEAVKGLSSTQLDTPYRPGGRTIRQVAHHLADTHINAYVRFKLALAEESPVVKSYDQERWSEFTDSLTAPVEASLSIFEGLYRRWTFLLRSLRPEDFARTFRHPDKGIIRLDGYLGICVWHGHHHIAHIKSLRQRMNW